MSSSNTSTGPRVQHLSHIRVRVDIVALDLVPLTTMATLTSMTMKMTMSIMMRMTTRKPRKTWISICASCFRGPNHNFTRVLQVDV